MAQNRWQLGVMFFGGLDLTQEPYQLTNTGTLNGKVFWYQADGPGTKVLPTEYVGPFTAYPIPGVVMSEYVPWWSPGCGHSCKDFAIVREFDYDTGLSCALICCNHCYYVQNIYEPFEEWLQPITHAIVVG